MYAFRLTPILAVSLLGLAAVSPARANHLCAGDLARQLQDQTGQLSAEIRGNFRQAPNYPQLMIDAQHLYGLSSQVDALLQARVNPRQLEGLVRRMDRMVADLEDRIDDAADFRHVGRYGGYGRPAGPCDTRCARRLLGSIDRTLANLDDALDDLHSHGPTPVVQPYRGWDDDYRGRGFVPTGVPNYGVGRRSW